MIALTAVCGQSTPFWLGSLGFAFLMGANLYGMLDLEQEKLEVDIDIDISKSERKKKIFLLLFTLYFDETKFLGIE
jgi:hypothetical protein